MLNNFLNYNSWNHHYLCLNEPFLYFELKTSRYRQFTRSRIVVNSISDCRFNLSKLPLEKFSNCRIIVIEISDRSYRPVTCKENAGLSFSRSRFAASVERLIFNSVQCRLAVIKMSDCRQCPEANHKLYLMLVTRYQAVKLPTLSRSYFLIRA